MAVGLGRMFGFRFPENFNYPYIATSIQEFWRRWHMSLSAWFRDYVYIPLGGNRTSTGRLYFNLVLVFFLCGLWHGAGLAFVAWGIYHGLLLVIERFAATTFNWRPSGLPGVVLSFVLVTIGWVFFRAPTMEAAWQYLGAMFHFGTGGDSHLVMEYLPYDIQFYLVAGLFFAFAPLDRLSRLRFDAPVIMVPQLGFSIVCLVFSMLLLATNSFNPFIYFRF